MSNTFKTLTNLSQIGRTHACNLRVCLRHVELIQQWYDIVNNLCTFPKVVWSILVQGPVFLCFEPLWEGFCSSYCTVFLFNALGVGQCSMALAYVLRPCPMSCGPVLRPVALSRALWPCPVPYGAVLCPVALSMLPNSPQPHEMVPGKAKCCLLYTSPSPRDRQKSRMPSSA